METSELRFVDTHCHLYVTEFDEDRSEMIRRAIEAGIDRMMLPNIDLLSLDGMLRVADQFQGHCYPMLGLHPCSVDKNYEEILHRMKDNLASEIFVGIGETGVDLYWDTSHKDLQIDAFEQQIEWAKEFDLPVIIHSRESLDLNLDIIERHQNGNLKGIFHCFGGTLDQAARIEKLGFKLGIGGIITFKNSPLAKILPMISPELIVLETDSPYLAPTPYRGKRNEPSYLVLIAQKVADTLGIGLQQVAELTSSNANAVFGKKG